MPQQSKKKIDANSFGSFIRASGQSRAPMADTSGHPNEMKGRAEGRRSREGYTQVGAYIPKALYKDVQKRLLDEDRNFSELVEDLLTNYLGK